MSPNPLEEGQLLIDTFAARNGADESNLRDILTDLMLWAEQHGVKFGDELTQATAAWLAESPQANEAVWQAWAAHGQPFVDDDQQVALEEAIAEMLADAQDNAMAELSDDEYGPDRLFHEEDLMQLGRRIGRMLTKTPLVVEEWFQTGELPSELERVGVTSAEILKGMGALLDRANTCEIPRDVLFRATNGKLYTIHVEAEIAEVAPDDDWALKTIATAREAEEEAAGEAADADDQPPAWIDRHSVDCADCGELVDERDCLPNPPGEGEVCTTCLDKRDEANRDKIIAAARAQYTQDGSIEIDQGAAFSRGEEDGLYVAAWVWVAGHF